MESVIIKLSGALTDVKSSVELISKYIHDLHQNSQNAIVIHGGGKQINELGNSLGVESTQIQGRRVTTKEVLKILTYTVAGSINIGLVSALRSNGLRAVGITGIDGEITTSTKRKPLIIEGVEVDFELVGEIEQVDTDLIQVLCNNGYTPVIGCLTWSSLEGILNINADTFATKLAVSCDSKELLVLMDPPFVRDANQIRIKELTENVFFEGISSGWIQGGMIPKLKTGFDALKAGVTKVRLTNPDGLITDMGTILTL
jgi:acetylglutamate kinase